MSSLKYKNPETGEWEELTGVVAGMLPAVYDPQGKQTDIFQYVDDAVSNVTVEPEDILPAVTAADNGKFLRVKDGAWVVATVRNAEEVSF